MTRWPITSTTSRLLNVAALASLWALSGCSSDGQNDWSALWVAGKQSFSGVSSLVSLQQAAAIPYATLGVRIGGGPQQLLILAADNGRDRLWTSAAHVAIATHDGRITRTSGLPPDLSGHVSVGSQVESWTVPHAYRWNADFEDLNRYSVTVTCRVVPIANEDIEILGQKLAVLRVNEDCRAEQIGWTFQNVYWVDPVTGRVWRSKQTVHPDGDSLEIELLRPPASPG